jgi:PhnB protein
MKLNTYLSFSGDCRAAFEFYEQLLGGKIVAMIAFGETSAREFVAPAAHDRIMHAHLEVGDSVLMGTDSTPEHPYEGIKGSYVAIHVDEPAEAERIFQALSEDGKVEMPIQETFWALRYGSTVDRFGVPWMVNCPRPA